MSILGSCWIYELVIALIFTIWSKLREEPNSLNKSTHNKFTVLKKVTVLWPNNQIFFFFKKSIAGIPKFVEKIVRFFYKNVTRFLNIP